MSKIQCSFLVDKKVHRNITNITLIAANKQTVAKELEWRFFKKFRLALIVFRKKKRLSESGKRQGLKTG